MREYSRGTDTQTQVVVKKRVQQQQFEEDKNTYQQQLPRGSNSLQQQWNSESNTVPETGAVLVAAGEPLEIAESNKRSTSSLQLKYNSHH